MSSEQMDRRKAIGAIGVASAAMALGCAGESPTSPTSTTGATTTTGAAATSTNATCGVTPTETIGPYPSLVDLFRSDIREGKNGTLLTLTVRVVNANAACAVVPNANVEIWHVDAAGNYSQYGTQTAQTYLRGIRDHKHRWRSDVHDDLSRLVPGPRDAHSSRSDDRWSVEEGYTDGVSRERQQFGPRNRRVLIEGQQPDVEHLRRDLCG